MKWLFYFLVCITLISCRKDKVGYEPSPYALEIPSHFPDMLIPADNPLTAEGVELGRFLFYEKRLSGDNSMSCASCHMPENGFSDNNQFSSGIDGIQGNRQSMALVNLGWENFFFWDGRKTSKCNIGISGIGHKLKLHNTPHTVRH
jgi:cytochrome c peroxidase